MDSLNLDCSASSADNIFWFYRPPGNDSEWEPYKFSWCSELSPKTCHLDDNDKRLRIGSVSMEMNDAQFICVASCSTTLRNATAFIYLGVQGIFFLIFCDNWLPFSSNIKTFCKIKEKYDEDLHKFSPKPLQT